MCEVATILLLLWGWDVFAPLFKAGRVLGRCCACFPLTHLQEVRTPPCATLSLVRLQVQEKRWIIPLVLLFPTTVPAVLYVPWGRATKL